MKTAFIKTTIATSLFAGVLLLASCNDKVREGEMNNETQTLEAEDSDYDNDTIVTETDSVTAVNRQDNDLDVGKQVP